jgi:hypothetical protein
MCTKCQDPSSVPPWSLRLPWILGVQKWPTWPTLRRMYLILVLTILFTCTSCARNPTILYLCCMVARWSGYLTQAFDCTLVKVLHYSLIRWERCAIASQDHLALAGELAWRQHGKPQLHRRLTLRRPNGTLGMGVATRWWGHHFHGYNHAYLLELEFDLFFDCGKAPTCNSCHDIIWIPIWVFYYSMEISSSLLWDGSSLMCILVTPSFYVKTECS